MLKWNADNDSGHWRCQQDFEPDAFGFVYLMTTPEGKMYVGKKQCKRTMKRPPLKGRKNKRHCIVDTDWRTYTSSSKVINDDIEKNGIKGYKFEILHFCSCKWELSYLEAKEQFDRGVIFKDDYLNGIINLRIPTAPQAMKEKYDR
jgi:hypothetical protein